jgi:hypothetical protein
MAARRLWTLFIALKRVEGAFFCGTPGAWAQQGAPQGVGARGSDATLAADETRRAGQAGGGPLQDEQAPRKSLGGGHTMQRAPRSEGMGLKGAKPGPGAALVAMSPIVWGRVLAQSGRRDAVC